MPKKPLLLLFLRLVLLNSHFFSSKPKKPPPIYVYGKFEKYSSLYAFIKEGYGHSNQLKYLGDKMKFNFDTIEHYNKFKAQCLNTTSPFTQTLRNRIKSWQ